MTITLSNPTRSDATWHILSGMTDNGNSNNNSSDVRSFTNGDDISNNNMSISDANSNHATSSTSSNGDDIFNIWPERGRIRGCGYGQPFTQDLKVTFRPKRDVQYSKIISFIVDKGRGCDITLKGRGTYDERIEAIIK